MHISVYFHYRACNFVQNGVKVKKFMLRRQSVRSFREHFLQYKKCMLGDKEVQ